MKNSGFDEVVAKIIAKDKRYRLDGYKFLKEALEEALKKRSKLTLQHRSAHVTAEALLDEFRCKALKEFGPMSMTVLEYWGIYNCSDIGQMVFHLIDAGVIAQTKNDSFADFNKGFDFHEAFSTPSISSRLDPDQRGFSPEQKFPIS